MMKMFYLSFTKIFFDWIKYFATITQHLQRFLPKIFNNAKREIIIHLPRRGKIIVE